MPDLTNIEAIERQLQTFTERVNLGDDEPTATNNIDMSYATADEIRVQTEATIIARLSRFYATPLTLSNETDAQLLKGIATRLTSYEIWCVLHPQFSVDELPAAVAKWREVALDILKQIVPDKVAGPIAGETIILQGETQITSAGAASQARVGMTRGLPFGGSSGS